MEIRSFKFDLVIPWKGKGVRCPFSHPCPGSLPSSSMCLLELIGFSFATFSRAD